MPKVKRPTGRAQAAELSRTAIAATARRLFQERGYNQSTVESIAAEAGYAVQTVYFHFKSKAAIVEFVRKSFSEGAALIKSKGDNGMNDLRRLHIGHGGPIKRKRQKR